MRTGDLALWHADELYVTGRSKEIIFVNGQNYYPHDLEMILQGEQGLEHGKVAAAGVRNPDAPTDELVLFVLHRTDMTDFLPLATRAQRKVLHSDLRSIVDSPDTETAWRRINEVLSNWRDLKPEVAEKIEEEIEETTAVLDFPPAHRKRIRTTNALERLNQELRRRTRVARIFPNDASCLRLIASLAIEQSEEWETGRQYLDVSLLEEWSFEGNRQWPCHEPAEPSGELTLVPAEKQD